MKQKELLNSISINLAATIIKLMRKYGYDLTLCKEDKLNIYWYNIDIHDHIIYSSFDDDRFYTNCKHCIIDGLKHALSLYFDSIIDKVNIPKFDMYSSTGKIKQINKKFKLPFLNSVK